MDCEHKRIRYLADKEVVAPALPRTAEEYADFWKRLPPISPRCADCGAEMPYPVHVPKQGLHGEQING